MPDLDAASVVRVLNNCCVAYVVIGGIAAQLHDMAIPATIDIDLTPSRDHANLARLAQAFEDLDAGLFSADEGGTWFPRVPVENWAQYDNLHLMTRYGPVDIVFAPDGAPGGFADLAPTAVRLAFADQHVLVVTPTTWEMLKHASGREKDLAHLDSYYAAVDRTQRLSD